MGRRKHLPTAVVEELLVACRRRCCLCFFLQDDRSERKGQIAHLNQRPDDARLENLAWLCLDHHDAFDSRTRQSKGYTASEVRRYRDQLIAELGPLPGRTSMLKVAEEVAVEAEANVARSWRYPLWMIADQPELFAFTAPGADGICAIERVDLPDGRIVIACIEMPGNPGKSITNAAEYIFAQVCERFDLAPQRIVWLENYESFDRADWRLVTFGSGIDESAAWTSMTPAMWESLSLSPKNRVKATSTGALRSKLRKLFPWPPATLALGLEE